MGELSKKDQQDLELLKKLQERDKLELEREKYKFIQYIKSVDKEVILPQQPKKKSFFDKLKIILGIK